MQRGPLLQPLRSTERVLSGPPRAHPSGCVQPFRLRRAQPAPARALARRRASMASSFSLVPLHRRSKPTRKAGFPLGVCSAKASLLSQGEAPLKARFPLRRIRLTPFPQSCHGFVLAPSSRQKPRQPRVSANLCRGGFTPEPSPSKKSNPEYRLRFFSGLSSSVHPQQPFLAGGYCLPVGVAVPPVLRLESNDFSFYAAASESSAAVAPSPFRLPCGAR